MMVMMVVVVMMVKLRKLHRRLLRHAEGVLCLQGLTRVGDRLQ
jgi:hypothetical protein